MPTNRLRQSLFALLIVVSVTGAAAAQDSPPASTPPPAPAQEDDDPDRDPNDNQPDFYVATLHTNLPVPKGKGNFRLTHRFLRPLGEGDFGDLAGRLFGLDGGAQIGLDFRYGIVRNLNVGIYRTSDRTIQLSAQYNAIRDGNGPIGVSVVANVDGTDNFSDEFSPGLALVLSRELGGRGAIYLQPSFVNNTRFGVSPGDDYTVTAGIGARLRLGRNSFVFAEGSPRVAGFDQGVTHASFGFEQRYGGHVFQLNVSNGFGTTLAQVARGGTPGDNWYLGFNLTRKFF
ncbi:MAG TPA: DUF5777 family beta-barrel protein [Vicinamibacterales bacterium]|nr:DUF5777 family beta-barrel protein [Vicinamibacterales bacterium]